MNPARVEAVKNIKNAVVNKAFFHSKINLPITAGTNGKHGA